MKEGVFIPVKIDEENFSEYLQQRKMVLVDEDSIGEIEDICGQLNDVEGEYQKLVEECIERLLKLIKPYENMKKIKTVWNVDYGFWEKVDLTKEYNKQENIDRREKEATIAELERDAKEGNL